MLVQPILCKVNTMYKKHFGVALLILIVSSLIGFLFHNILLESSYQETSNLWRAKNDLRLGTFYTISAIYSFIFVFLYTSLTRGKKRTLNNAIGYGVLLGVGKGLMCGYGAYSFMPIPYTMAFAWFAEAILSSFISGALLGYFFQSTREEQA